MSSKYTTIKTDEPKVRWSTTIPIDNIRRYPRSNRASNKHREGTK